MMINAIKTATAMPAIQPHMRLIDWSRAKPESLVIGSRYLGSCGSVMAILHRHRMASGCFRRRGNPQTVSRVPKEGRPGSTREQHLAAVPTALGRCYRPAVRRIAGFTGLRHAPDEICDCCSARVVRPVVEHGLYRGTLRAALRRAADLPRRAHDLRGAGYECNRVRRAGALAGS